jgi:hypothetical protein
MKIPTFDTSMSPADFEKYHSNNINNYPESRYRRLSYIAMFRRDLLSTYFRIADPSYLLDINI